MLFAFICWAILGLFFVAWGIYMFFANRILEYVFQKYMRPDDLQAQQQFEQ